MLSFEIEIPVSRKLRFELFIKCCNNEFEVINLERFLIHKYNF